MARLALLLFLCALLAACAPAPTPTPAPRPLPPAPSPVPPITYSYHFPIAPARSCPPAISPRKNIAATSHGDEDPNYAPLLCMPTGFLCATWNSKLDQGHCRDGRVVPQLWGMVGFTGFDHLAHFRNTFPPDYTGHVLFANEPDRPDQANLTPAQTAWLVLQGQAHCPGCRWVGPGLSNAEFNGLWAARFWRKYLQGGGQVGRITALGLHIYWQGSGFEDGIDDGNEIWPADKINAFYAGLESQLRAYDIPAQTVIAITSKPLWITEVGYSCWLPDPGRAMARYLSDLEQHPRVKYYFFFTDRDPLPGEYGYPRCYSAITHDGDLTAIGRAVRAAGRPAPSPTPPPAGYP